MSATLPTLDDDEEGDDDDSDNLVRDVAERLAVLVDVHVTVENAEAFVTAAAR